MIFTDSFVYMPELNTPRLRLRRLTMRDAADIYHYSRDAEVARHVLWDAHRSISDSRDYLRYMLRRYRSHEPASWGIEKTDFLENLIYYEKNISSSDPDVGSGIM